MLFGIIAALAVGIILLMRGARSNANDNMSEKTKDVLAAAGYILLMLTILFVVVILLLTAGIFK